LAEVVTWQYNLGFGMFALLSKKYLQKEGGDHGVRETMGSFLTDRLY